MNLRYLSRLVQQNIVYHCKNSPAWIEEKKQSVGLDGYDGEAISIESPMFYRPRVLVNDCNVSGYLSWEIITITQMTTSQLLYSNFRNSSTTSTRLFTDFTFNFGE